MNKFEAEKIVNAYGGAIAKGNVKRISWLPCSKPRIKQAFFTYIDAAIKDFKNLPQDIGEHLVMCYAMLNMFVDEREADHLDMIIRQINGKDFDFKNPNNVKLVNERINYTKRMIDGGLYDEINEFIGECYEKYKVN